MIHVPGGISSHCKEWLTIKQSELFISGIFHLTFSEQGFNNRVTELKESKTVDKGGLLYT